jgi:hypothetical protein
MGKIRPALAEQDIENDDDAGLLDSRPPGADEPSSPDSTIGRIALKQVRVSRAEAEARTRDGEPSKKPPSNSPLNRLVPYLDLFGRLTDEELSRLARTPISAVETLRQQVDEVNRVLSRYVDLLPRLSDDEMIRLTGGTPKTIRFWRLCQPRPIVDTRSRTDVPQATLRETSAVRSVVQAYEDGSSDQMQVRHFANEPSTAIPAAITTEADSGTMIVDEQVARFRRE